MGWRPACSLPLPIPKGSKVRVKPGLRVSNIIPWGTDNSEFKTDNNAQDMSHLISASLSKIQGLGILSTLKAKNGSSNHTLVWRQLKTWLYKSHHDPAWYWGATPPLWGLCRCRRSGHGLQGSAFPNPEARGSDSLGLRAVGRVLVGGFPLEKDTVGGRGGAPGWELSRRWMRHSGHLCPGLLVDCSRATGSPQALAALADSRDVITAEAWIPQSSTTATRNIKLLWASGYSCRLLKTCYFWYNSDFSFLFCWLVK